MACTATRTRSSASALRSRAPLDVIRSATSAAADLLGMSGEIGTLRTGAVADLVVVDGDPLTDVTTLADPTRIRHAVQSGLSV